MNNILLFIFNYFIVILTMTVLFKTYYQLAKIEQIKNHILEIIMILCSFLEIFIANYLSAIFNCILCLSFFILVEKIFTKKRLSEIVFYNVVIWLFLLLLDMLIMLGFNIVNLIFTFEVNSLIIRPFGTVVMDIFLIWITKSKLVINTIDKIKNYVFNLDVSIINVIVVFIIYFILDAVVFIKLKDRIVIESITFISIILLVLIVRIIFNEINLYNIKKTNQLLIKNNEFYITLIDNYRVFKHNLTSKLIGIKAISSPKASKVINDLIKEYNNSFQTSFDLKDAPSGINGLIYEKIYNFNHQELKISVENKINNDILDIISPRSYNLLCEALGVVLDNALEAAYKSKEKVIYLRFLEEEKTINVLVMNTFEGELEIENIGKLNYTTKKEGHGLGIYSLLNKRKINLKTKIKNNVFTNQITVMKK